MTGAGIERYRGPQYARLLAAARRSLERTGGSLTGRVSISDPDDAERRAVIGITGMHQPARTRRLTVQLTDLDAALRGATGLRLPDVLAALGGPVRDRPAEVASLAAARTALARMAQASPLQESRAWYRQWLAQLAADGTLTRLARQDAAVAVGHAAAVLEYLDGRAGDPVTLPELAALATGDTKALSHGTTLSTLVLRALALRAGVPRPESAGDRRELWDSSGVIADDLASRVLVLGVRADGDGLGEWLTGAARYGTPFQVTLHQLTAHPVRLSHPRVFACENPAVLRRACTELGAGCPPLICTEGRPSAAFGRLARLVIAGGGELWYHGDFDWPGVAIAADIIERHVARPWRMGADDYAAAARADDGLPAAPASGHVALAGDPVATPWDPALATAMRAAGRAVYEESVADSLLADLRGYC